MSTYITIKSLTDVLMYNNICGHRILKYQHVANIALITPEGPFSISSLKIKES